MTLQEILNIITASEPDQWNSIACWGASSGPSYRYQIVDFEVYEGQKNVLRTKDHSIVAAFTPDVSITMAWGLGCNEDFKEVWANKFPDPRASSHYVDIFYNGAMVFRDLYVSVDGGRAKLPLPERKIDDDGKVLSLEVPVGEHKLIRLVDSLGGYISQFDSYFKRAEFSLSNKDWSEKI